jgi:RNA methyltransferase, TrmH family
MAEETITSRKNSLVVHARAVRDGREKALLFVEGIRLCEEALSAGVEFEFAFFSPSLEEDERGALLVKRLRESCARVVAASEGVIASASDTATPQGIIAIARRPRTGVDVIEQTHVGLIGQSGVMPLVVVMHAANNPSNAGAMLRVAEAAGATGVITTKGSTDPLSPKSLRGSMGSAFRVPLWTGATFEEAIRWCAENKIKTVATSADAPRTHTEIDWTQPRAVLLGPEAAGLSETEARAADERVRIPMRAPVESLNVAVALGVILYEAARQRELLGRKPDREGGRKRRDEG